MMHILQLDLSRYFFFLIIISGDDADDYNVGWYYFSLANFSSVKNCLFHSILFIQSCISFETKDIESIVIGKKNPIEILEKYAKNRLAEYDKNKNT